MSGLVRPCAGYPASTGANANERAGTSPDEPGHDTPWSVALHDALPAGALEARAHLRRLLGGGERPDLSPVVDALVAEVRPPHHHLVAPQHARILLLQRPERGLSIRFAALGGNLHHVAAGRFWSHRSALRRGRRGWRRGRGCGGGNRTGRRRRRRRRHVGDTLRRVGRRGCRGRVLIWPNRLGFDLLGLGARHGGRLGLRRQGRKDRAGGNGRPGATGYGHANRATRVDRLLFARDDPLAAAITDPIISQLAWLAIGARCRRDYFGRRLLRLDHRGVTAGRRRAGPSPVPEYSYGRNQCQPDHGGDGHDTATALLRVGFLVAFIAIGGLAVVIVGPGRVSPLRVGGLVAAVVLVLGVLIGSRVCRSTMMAGSVLGLVGGPFPCILRVVVARLGGTRAGRAAALASHRRKGIVLADQPS